MALLFGAASSDRVDHGNIAAAPTAFTILHWANPNSVATASKRLAAKGGTTGFINYGMGLTSNIDHLRLTIDYSTTDALADSVAGVIETNKWQFFAGSFDGTNAPKLYKGTLTTTVAEVTYSATPVAPVGTRVAEGVSALYLGNDSAFTRSFAGSIHFFAWWNRVLTLGEIQEQQFRPHRTSGCILLSFPGFNGTGTQPDWSGSSHSGTVTGATVTAGAPLPAPFATHAPTPYVLFHALSRTVAGDQPAATGTLTRVWNAHTAVTGSEPAATGTATGLAGSFRTLTGSEPNATGALARLWHALRSLAGSQPNATGALSYLWNSAGVALGNQPNPTGAITKIQHAFKTLAGSEPAASGTLSRVPQVLSNISGAQMIYWGFWKDELTSTGDSVSTGMDALAGKRLSHVVFVRPWYNSGYVYPSAFSSLLTTIRGHGQIPVLGWMTTSWAGSPPSSLSNANIASGAHDAFLGTFADQIAALNYPVMILLDEEMNGSWNTWYDGTGVSFVNMWRHVVGIFNAHGATNATWLWCANGVVPGGSLIPWWPGKDYVDWAGVDVFNTSYSTGAPWLTFDQILHGDGSWWGDSWTALTNLDTTGKVRYALTSFSSDNRNQAGVDDFAGRAAWITDAFGKQIPHASGAARDYSKLEMVLWFNQNEPHAAPINVDVRDIGDDQPSTDAFRAPTGIGSAYYLAGGTFLLPTGLAPLKPFSQTSQPDPLGTALLSTSRLQGLWYLDQASGTLLDTSGNSRNLTTNGSPTLNQAAVVPSSTRHSVSFPGSTATWLDAGNINAWSIPTTGQLSGGCAFIIPSLPASGQFYALMSVAGGTGFEWALRILSDGRLEFITWDLGGTTASSAAGGSIALNQRYLAVFAIDQTKAGSGSGASRSHVYLIPQAGAADSIASADVPGVTPANGTGTLQLGRRGDGVSAMPSGSRIGYAFMTDTEVTPITIETYRTSFQSADSAAPVGNQPNATGALTRVAQRIARLSWLSLSLPQSRNSNTASATVAGNQLSASGTLSRVWHTTKSLAGPQPFSTGVLTKVAQRIARISWLSLDLPIGNASISLIGIQPPASGALTRMRFTASAVQATGTPRSVSLVGDGTNWNDNSRIELHPGVGVIVRGLEILTVAPTLIQLLVTLDPASSGRLTYTVDGLSSSAAVTAISLGTVDGAQLPPSGALAQVAQRIAQISWFSLQLPNSQAGLNRALTGAQLPATGVLAKRLATTRTLAGAQPTASGTIAKARLSTKSLDGSQDAPSGTLTEITSRLRVLGGSEPAATGGLDRTRNSLKSLLGDQPGGSGVVGRLLHALRALTGSEPAATGVLAKIMHTLRTLTGSQPAASGALTTRLATLRTLTGLQPAASGTLSKTIAVSRLLAGNQLAPSGSLSSLWSGTRSSTVAGSQPAATGALTTFTLPNKILAGNQPNATGTTTRLWHTFRALIGLQPNATGDVLRVRQTVAPFLGGEQPEQTGELLYVKHTARTPTGSEPSGSGTLTRSVPFFSEIEGDQPGANGDVIADDFKRVLPASQPGCSGLLSVRITQRRFFDGDQPSPFGAGRNDHAELGVAPAASGTLEAHLVGPFFWRARLRDRRWKATIRK